MKNRLKRLQLTVRIFRKKGIIFGAVFVLTLSSLSIIIPKLNTHADPADPEIITSANANIITPIGDANPNFNATPSDDTKYSTVIQRWNLEEDPDYPYLTETDFFETSKDYTVRVYFVPNEGYAFSEDTIFTINSGETTSYGSLGQRQRTFYDTPPHEEEATFTVTYDLNGATAGGEGVITTQTAPVGIDLTEDNLITLLGVTAPEGQVLNYVTVDDAPFNIGDGLFIDRDMTIKYFWREETSVFYEINLDLNGGTAVDFDVPPAAPAGQAFVMNAPGEDQVTPPEGQEFDAFEVNGVRYEGGSLITIDSDSSVKLLWKNTDTPDPVYYTVKYDDGGILQNADRLTDQTVLAGEMAPEPENSYGERLTEILTEVSGKYYYNDYELIDLFTDPDFTTPFNGGPITENTTVYLKWYDTLEQYEQIPEVNLIVTPPEAGTEITMEDEEDRDTQEPQLLVTLPDDARYNLWTDSEEENYAYWVKEKSFWSDPFVGVLEKGGKYYAEVWVRSNEPDEVIFARNVVVKVNGVALPAEQISYDIDSIVAIVEIDLSEEDDSAVPDTGAYTMEGGSALATVMGTIIALVLVSGAALLKFKK
ncbi:hypothetical protein IKG38_02685 [Candidatus Saccharibacteria bacterium]|nr:hypothetical protein [Candidatus Saccharibacteria bacterium]